MICVDTLIAQARQWIGVPFLHQGRTRSGCDCLGFIAALLAELGSNVLLDHLPRNYGRNPQAQLLIGLESLCREIQLEPGALIVIQFPLSPFPSHAGIYTGENMIHCYEAVGRVTEHGYRAPWPARTASIWALPLVTYS